MLYIAWACFRNELVHNYVNEPMQLIAKFTAVKKTNLG